MFIEYHMNKARSTAPGRRVCSHALVSIHLNKDKEEMSTKMQKKKRCFGSQDDSLFFSPCSKLPVMLLHYSAVIIKKHLNVEGRRNTQQHGGRCNHPGLPRNQEESSTKTRDGWRGWLRGASRPSSRKRLGPAFLPRLPSCVLRRPRRPTPWEKRGPRLLIQIVHFLLLPAPSGAGGLSTEVLPVRWDVEWYPAQLHR